MVVIQMERVKRPFIIDSNSKESRMSEYQPLTDHHLGVYFSNPNVRKVLKKAGIVSEKGEVVQKAFRTKESKIVLPPIRFHPIYRSTGSGMLTMRTTKYSTTSTGALKSIRNSEEEPISPKVMNTDPGLDLSKPTPSKKPKPTPAGKPQWGYKTLRPLNHDEYESMLQKFYSTASLLSNPTNPPSHPPVNPSEDVPTVPPANPQP